MYAEVFKTKALQPNQTVGLTAPINYKDIFFGKFTDCAPTNSHADHFIQDEVISAYAERLKVPEVRGLMFGHVVNQTTFPLGIWAELDMAAKTLRIQENTVSEQ